eukprot:TRINITY_DN9311_c0_g1_i1.p1 TRINITY_DN9311_c0_g1~~TRINITY_DN9311_c0_g1_i1.p1  ORF type:complete len:447 (+),score=94.59 TRINITY_DN9311_c0_g1_i1:12-1352(+)
MQEGEKEIADRIWKVLKSNHPEDAVEDSEYLVDHFPFSFSSYVLRGLVRYETECYEEAIRDFGVAIQMNDQYALPFFHRGCCYKDMKDFEKALQDFDRAIDIDPRCAGAFRCRATAKTQVCGYHDPSIIEDLDICLSIDPEDIDAHYIRGRCKLILKEYEEALQSLEMVCILNDDYPDVYFWKGVVREHLEQSDIAINDYETAIKHDFKTKTVHRNLGMLYQERGEYSKALECFETSVLLEPIDSVNYYARALAKTSLGDFDGAIDDYSRCIELDPTFGAAYNNRGEMKRSKKDYEGALVDFDKALEINPYYTNGLYNRGLTRQSLRDFEGALQDYTRILEIDPNDVQALTKFKETETLLDAQIGFVDMMMDFISQNPDINQLKEMKSRCAHCDAPRPKKKCGHCLTYKYCNRDCQKAHWPEHKKTCKLISVAPQMIEELFGPLQM